MPSADPRSWFDKAVGACLGILVGAAAVYIAVKLVEAVATALFIIVAVALFVAVAVAVMRSRRNGW